MIYAPLPLLFFSVGKSCIEAFGFSVILCKHRALFLINQKFLLNSCATHNTTRRQTNKLLIFIVKYGIIYKIIPWRKEYGYVCIK